MAQEKVVNSKPPESTLPRLLWLKQRLGLSRQERPAPDAGSTAMTLARIACDLRIADEPDDDFARLACINCGYCQHGVRTSYCPECGLPLASFYHDPTPWGIRQDLPAWWATAMQIWCRDARLRLRASLMPATPAARQFARWSILVTAILASIAFAVGHVSKPGSNWLLAGLYGAVQFGEALVVITISLLGVVYALMLGTKGMWRRRHRFVPGSIYYAAAWWPPIAGALLVFTALHSCSHVSELLILMVGSSVLGVVQWALWLWSSLFDSERVTYPALRIGLVVLVFTLTGGLALLTVPGISQWTVSRIFAAGETGLARLRIFGSLSVGPRAAAPKTYALIINAIPGYDSDLMLQALEKLGADRVDRVVILGAETTLSNIQ